MAYQEIQYEDKVTAQTSALPENKKATKDTYNEIKSVVNNNKAEGEAVQSLVNGVQLETGGDPANFLNAEGDYIPVGGGGTQGLNDVLSQNQVVSSQAIVTEDFSDLDLFLGSGGSGYGGSLNIEGRSYYNNSFLTIDQDGFRSDVFVYGGGVRVLDISEDGFAVGSSPGGSPGGSFTEEFLVNGDTIIANLPVVFPTYTVATLPLASNGGTIYVSDETGGFTMAFSDLTNWRRVQDRQIVS